ncbi:MAG TPA: PilT/PilU family type 4a pilus ATPase [Methylomirabilota bacterium]|jgi:twitching motility protein PilU
MTTLDGVLSEAVTSGASDVYFLEGVTPSIKVDGLISPVSGADPLDAAAMRGILERLLPVRERAAFAEAGEANLSHMHPILGRFRVNCYRAMGVSGAVLRRVKTDVPTIEALELPQLLGSLALERQGLILLVGATGAGKSTTVAAMLHHRITRSRGHVVTIEDPVEFLHASDQSIVSQREVGIDTESYLVGLRNALRQAPDVIFVGELRDPETVSVALHSAETGHLVVSTLHATNATTAVERLLHFFQPEVRTSVLLQLSLTLRAVAAQRLVPRAEGKGRVAAMELMLVTSRIQALIRRGELETIRQAIEEGTNEGLRTFDQALFDLFQRKAICQDDAVRFADSPNNLRLRMKGIR